ncbi:MAG: ATP-binding protein [Firmicutes bacterium]|nr:ATP-binding protein [Bacillota bacterium]
MKYREVTHRTVEKIVFGLSSVFFFLFGLICYLHHMPVYITAVMLCIPVVTAVFTFVPPLTGSTQAYAMAICMNLAATVYAIGNSSLCVMHGAFLVIMVFTALYRQIGLAICQIIYVSLLYFGCYLFAPDVLYYSKHTTFDIIGNLIVFYMGSAAVLLLIAWFQDAVCLAENRNQGISDLLKVVERQKIEAEAGTKEKADFLANMSHEMRTPMIAVCGMSELLLQNDLTPLEEEYVTTIRNSANNLLSLVNDILDFSKIDAGMMNLVEVHYNIENMVAEIANMINVRMGGEKDISFIVEIDANVPKGLIGDELRIRQILINLLNNAVKFTEKGMVKLKISYSMDEMGKSWIKADVEDTGIGITPADQKKLFAEFSQVDTQKNHSIQGTGLGLIISQRLANLMNGNITLESEYGKGSTFTVVIEQKVDDSEEIGIVPDPDGYVAYVYEPDDCCRENFKEIMSQLGVAVITISNISVWDYYNADRFGAILFFDYDSGIEVVNSFALKIKRMRIVTMIGANSFVDAGIKNNILMIHKPILTGQLSALIRGENLDTFRRERKPENHLFVPEARIMAVDDNYVNLRVIEGLLSVYKPQVRLVSSGREAYNILCSDMGFDLIFMDQMMPDWDGIETVQRIRALEGEYYKNVPIVALSANTSQNSRELFMSNGMNDFLEKPISTNALSNMIKKYIPREKQLSEYVEEIDPMMTVNRPINSEYISAASKNAGDVKIEGINTTDGIFNMGGSVDAYNHILNVVLEDGRKKIVFLEKYAIEGNLKAYHIESHAIKSVAASIGADSLSLTAKQHETAAKNGDADFVANNYRKLINEYTSVLRNIEEYLLSNNLLTLREDDSGENQNAPVISQQKKHNEIVEIIRLIERFDSDGAIDRLSGLLGYRLEKSDRAGIKKAINQLDDYMFDEAKNTLGSL